MCKGMTMGIVSTIPVLSRSSRTFGMMSMSTMNTTNEEISSKCQQDNSIFIATTLVASGPATEALLEEQSFKRRRLSNDSNNNNDDKTKEDESSSSSSAFCLDDAFNAISSIENEDYCDFPTIAWDFDD